MHAWEAIQKTLDYIEENIEKDIQIEELADVASLSMFYYQRLFSRLVKKPVREYIKLRRLAGACEALKNNKSHMVDIAIEYGFINRETFTRAFKEAFGITPSEYRKTSVKLNFFNKPDLLLNYILIDEGVPLISEGLVLEISRKTLEEPIDFVGVSGYVSFKGEMPSGLQTGIDVPGEIWNRFHNEKHRMPIKQNARGIGASYYGEAPKGFFTCFTGEEAESRIISSEFKIWTLPARKYIVCGFEAENFEELYKNALGKAYEYTKMWINKHSLNCDDFTAHMLYDNGDIYSEWWIPINE